MSKDIEEGYLDSMNDTLDNIGENIEEINVILDRMMAKLDEEEQDE